MEHEDIFVFRASGNEVCYCPSLREIRAARELCDVAIKVGNRFIPAHRIILAAGIPYFRSMFRSKLMESSAEEIELKNVDPLSLEQVINFLYTNELKITSSNVTSLLETSMYLLLDLVSNACFKFLSQRIDSSNVFTIGAYADIANKVEVLDAVNRYVRENFEDVALTEDFTELPYEKLKYFVSRDDLFVMSEKVVFEAVIRWVKSSEDSRSIYLPDLLRQVRIPLLTAEYINTRVSTEELVRTSAACVELVKEAKMYLERERSSYSLSTQERVCKRKQHLKCAQLAGSGMYVLCRGSESNMSVYYYDSFFKRWDFLLDSVDTGSVVPLYVVCTDEKIYILEQTRICSLDLKILGTTVVKIPDGPWSTDSGIVLHHQKIFFFGGSMQPRGVRILDLKNRNSAQVGAIVEGRILPGVASLGQYIYLIGGSSEDFHVLTSLERYHPETGQCDQMAAMITERVRPACTVLHEKIYVCGGFVENDISFNDTNVAEVYDPASNQWNAIRCMNGQRVNTFLAEHGRKLYAFGNTLARDLQVYTYDPNKNDWELDDFPPSHSQSCTVVAAVVTNSATNANVNYVELSDTDDSEETDSGTDDEMDWA